MRPALLACAILAAAPGCAPVLKYQEAARSLRYHLVRVEPGIRLALPVDRSRISFRVVLGVDNPSTVAFHVLGFSGDLKLEAGGTSRTVGRLELARSLDLPAQGNGQLDTELSFGYADLRDNWVAIQSAAKGGAATWHLDGALKVEAYGITLSLPVHTSRANGAPG